MASMKDLEAENARLRALLERNHRISFKISPKGGLSVYGLGRFPVTLYIEQWSRLLDAAGDLRAFLQAHDAELKRKQAAFGPVA